MLLQKLVKLRIKFLIILNVITTPEFFKLMAENKKKKETLNQANLVYKPDFDNKLISFNR